MRNILRSSALLCLVCLLAVGTAAVAHGQIGAGGVFSKLKLETRADAEWWHTEGTDASYGVHGRYFNLMVGGELGGGFTYYFRQRLKAEQGRIDFFDNTDFLWVSREVGDRWRLRFGKDAMAVGGFEYDAAPIDVYMPTEFWNNIYCFQLAASVAYLSADRRQTVVAQVSQSPYVNSLGLGWDAGLLAYNVEWLGSLGEHVQTLWSTSMVERQRGIFMNLTVLGTQVGVGRWSLYADLMHHALSADDWGRNFGGVARLDCQMGTHWNLFVKGSYEQNKSEVEQPGAGWIDQMVPAGHSYAKLGVGTEWHPKGLHQLRVHGYLAWLNDWDGCGGADRSLTANAGLSWALDFIKLFKQQ